MESICVIIILFILFAIGVPVPFALAGAGIIGIWWLTGSVMVITSMLGSTPFTTVASYILTTIPTFILMAFFSASGGLAQDLFDAMADWLSHIRGGLAIATVFACAIFGAMSGASVAAASVMAAIALPSMRKYGYSEILAAGTVGVGSTLDILIPPSIAMVFYGILAEQSIGRLLIAGIVPGLICGILLSIIIYVWVFINPGSAPRLKAKPWSVRIKGLYRTWPSFVLIILVIGLLFSGIATPTEVGAIGAFLAAVIGFAMRRLTLAGAWDAIKRSINISSMIMMIFIGGLLFGYFVTISQMPQQLVEAIAAMDINRWVILIGVCVAFFFISMFMDEMPLTLITVQLTLPILIALGFDPVWFGVLMAMLLCIGLVFPPVGTIAFVVSSVGNIDLGKVYKGTTVLTIALLITTILLMIFPQLALWLPNLMR